MSNSYVTHHVSESQIKNYNYWPTELMALIVKIYHHQGHPTTVFCKLFFLRSKYFLEFSNTWGWVNFFRWLFHSWTMFEAYVINSQRFCEVWFSRFASQVRLFFVEKREPKIFGFKNVMARGIRKILIFIYKCIQFHEKIFGKIILKPLKFREDSMTEQIQILWCNLECIARDLKLLRIA